MSSFTATADVVHVPTIQLLREDFAQALAGAARATSASTDDIGDYFNMAMALKLSIDQTPDDATVFVPLFNIEDGAIANASILASGPTPESPPAKDGLRQVYRVLSGGGVPTFSDWNPHQVSPANPPLGC